MEPTFFAGTRILPDTLGAVKKTGTPAIFMGARRHAAVEKQPSQLQSLVLVLTVCPFWSRQSVLI